MRWPNDGMSALQVIIWGHARMNTQTSHLVIVQLMQFPLWFTSLHVCKNKLAIVCFNITSKATFLTCSMETRSWGMRDRELVCLQRHVAHHEYNYIVHMERCLLSWMNHSTCRKVLKVPTWQRGLPKFQLTMCIEVLACYWNFVTHSHPKHPSHLYD